MISLQQSQVVNSTRIDDLDRIEILCTVKELAGGGPKRWRMVSMQHERLPETHVVGIIGAHGVGKSDLTYRVCPPSLHQETTNSRVPPASHRVFLRGL